VRIASWQTQGRLHDERNDVSITTLSSPAGPGIRITSELSRAASPRLREAFPVELLGLTITPVTPAMWRVSRTGGPVLGHIELRDVDGHFRYSARRVVNGGVRASPLGEFWSPRDAAECFR
jgi:hypothetical protein